MQNKVIGILYQRSSKTSQAVIKLQSDERQSTQIIVFFSQYYEPKNQINSSVYSSAKYKISGIRRTISGSQHTI